MVCDGCKSTLAFSRRQTSTQNKSLTKGGCQRMLLIDPENLVLGLYSISQYYRNSFCIFFGNALIRFPQEVWVTRYQGEFIKSPLKGHFSILFSWFEFREGKMLWQKVFAVLAGVFLNLRVPRAPSLYAQSPGSSYVLISQSSVSVIFPSQNQRSLFPKMLSYSFNKKVIICFWWLA